MTSMPLAKYTSDLKRPGFVVDEAQRAAVIQLDLLCRELTLCHTVGVEQYGVMSQVGRYFKALVSDNTLEPVKGIYLWGGVGRGKTYVMDVFYDSLPFPQKMRTHFHRFMRRVHGELAQLKEHKDPLKTVAKVIAGEAKVICFDEFFVSDITDAMILAGLLEELFSRGVTLVATSNIEPGELYKDGLQRARFLPAIDLIGKYTEVFNLDNGIDYRLRTLEKANLYHTPLGGGAQKAMGECFESLVPDLSAIRVDVSISVEGRQIQALKVADDVVWFDFMSVCDGPRSQNDYIELAREFHAVLVSNIPLMGAFNDDQVKRFIYLVDEFYDRKVKLILSAEKPIHELYVEGRLSFEFQRAVSRIREMQSHDYLACAHLA